MTRGSLLPGTGKEVPEFVPPPADYGDGARKAQGWAGSPLRPICPSRGTHSTRRSGCWPPWTSCPSHTYIFSHDCTPREGASYGQQPHDGSRKKSCSCIPGSSNPRKLLATGAARGPVQARVPAVCSSLLCQLSAARRVWRDRDGSGPSGSLWCHHLGAQYMLHTYTVWRERTLRGQ